MPHPFFLFFSAMDQAAIMPPPPCVRLAQPPGVKSEWAGEREWAEPAWCGGDTDASAGGADPTARSAVCVDGGI
jgi:hypothetical protein